MRVLLVCKSKLMENLGVMYLSAVVKQCGHECRITYQDDADCDLIHYRPDIVGYSIMTGDQKLFSRFNERFGSKFTSIAGGPHPSFFPNDPIILEGKYDNIVQGEAEQWFADFLQSGIQYPNIDSLPWPDRTGFPEYKVRDFISTRGCLNNCSYCYNKQWADMHPQFDRVRTRNPLDVCKEIKSVNPQFAYFQDSCFALSMNWLQEFTQYYCKIPYHCHLRPKQVNSDRVALLKHSNCVSIRMALESASDRLRKLMNRPALDTQNVLNASELLRKVGIKFMIQNILALPSSTIEEDLATLEFNIRCRPDYGWASIFSPYPGTVLGDACKLKGWYKGDYSDITDCFFDKSVLEFDEEYKEQTYVLQKVFALCTETQYMPKVEELRIENLPKLIHAAMRKLGDRRIYGGVL
jgi:radical SAM superfamily enzyme YgiQ (UPF0313 family)